MSFPEGPIETEQDDSHDAVDPAPTDGFVAGVARAVRKHVATWPGRYVEMRVEARSPRRK
ncbi:hypothetical protein KTS45_07725 [Halomicroarcula limicola]|uniref:Uncharacterized protein n=1 Tax=Haloarcula limicola TaxID=1429915 RepID=A0A8J7Y4J6_9EURY|nr:hypothetical protein [Halomicroarcula limicola]MBV0924092.1 hypothetical protein [Halomicroarcula limicola]